MEWDLYQKRFKISAKKKGYPNEFIQECLLYAKKLNEQNYPIIYNVEHLSRLLGYTSKYLYKITNEKNKNYRKYRIPKKNGNFRTITEPYFDLKNIQTWILDNILYHISVSPYAKAYIPKHSLRDNVKFHIKQPVVIKLDLTDFFPSIKEGCIVKIFMQMGYSSVLSGLLGKLCCYENSLPQGAPTSPYLSNIYCRRIDKRIGNYITKLGFRYTRYSDDITISGNISDRQIGTIIKFCKKCLNEAHLQLNEEKTQILRHSNRQVVTGVVLNDKISAGVRKKKEIRQEIYYIKKFGLESHILHKNIEKQNYIYHLAGKINWVLELERNNKEFLEYKSYVNKIIQGNNEER